VEFTELLAGEARRRLRRSLCRCPGYKLLAVRRLEDGLITPGLALHGPRFVTSGRQDLLGHIYFGPERVVGTWERWDMVPLRILCTHQLHTYYEYADPGFLGCMAADLRFVARLHADFCRRNTGGRAPRLGQ